MNTFMKRFFTAALCLLLLLGMTPGVFAQEAGGEEAATGLLGSVEKQPLTGACTEPVVQHTSCPAAAAMGAKQQLPQSRTVATLPAPEPVASERTFVDSNGGFDEAIQYMRDQMTARSGQFQFVYVTDYSYDADAAYQGLFYEAMLHTGSPKEGDYLLWHYAGDGGNSWYQMWEQGGKQYVRYCFSIRYYTTAAQEQQVDKAVSDLLRSLELGGCTDYQKVKKIYDWICSNITYDYDGLDQGIQSSPLTWTAYKALTQGTSVCQGYASLFYRLALECGIDARVVSGVGNGGGHGWNIVKLGSYYYNLDTTWDAINVQYGCPYEYFLRCPANFADHYREAEYDTAEFHSYYPMSPADYTPGAPVAGDMDGDERLSTDDAVYLLLNVMFGSGDYAISASVRRDTDGDGKVTTDDAVYLLLHVMFGPKDYPLAA